jgi:GAF domain-containing protein
MRQRDKTGGKAAKTQRLKTSKRCKETNAARLARELKEAREQQVATADVLKVISRSPMDAQPVFDMIAERAARLCEGQFCFVYRFDGLLLHFVAHHSLTPEVLEMNRRAYPAPPSRRSAAARAILERRFVQIPDINADPDYVLGAQATVGRYRSVVGVPILRDGLPIGAIAVARAPAGLLPDRQIELLKTFADQAAIAIENARLFSETKEALEQQTATSEVLKVISSSSGKLEPVFQTMLANAIRICEAAFGSMLLMEGQVFRRVALHNAPPMFLEFHKKNPVIPIGQVHDLNLLLETRQPVHIADAAGTEDSPIVKYGGARTLVIVPMLKEGEIIGAIGIYRQEVRPFTGKQIELVTNFAAQAVIAIENTRLLNELRHRTDDLSESLEQQTATSEILEVISNSPTDTQPAFEAIVRSGLNLFPDAVVAISLPDRDRVKLAAIDGADESGLEALRGRYPMPLSHEFITGTAILDRREIDLADAHEPPKELTAGAQNLLAGGYRAMTVIPMMRGDETIGALNVIRRHPGPLSDKERKLLRTFANQAVIAIENMRLFNELRESLQQQTATADVLKVISTSPGDLEPVFKAILANATVICGAKFGTLYLRKDDAFYARAFHNAPPAFVAARKDKALHPSTQSTLGRAAATKQVAQVLDATKREAYRQGDPFVVAGADLGGYRTIVSVPMLKDDELVGVITIYRQEVMSFTDKQIELVKNFAAQAVIAIENTRLLSELRESLQQQTATADVLKVISASPGDLGPVFEAMLANAVRICEANFGVLFRSQDVEFYPAAWAGVPPEYEEFLRRRGQFRPTDGAPLDRLLKTKQLVFTVDELAERHPGPAAEFGGARSLIAVPMFKDGALVGAIVIYRQEVRPFTDRQVALVSNFSSQAVIAIENARLLSELRESLQQQTATADVLKVISSSPGDLEPVFQAMLEKATQLCEAKFGVMFRFADGIFRATSWLGNPPAHIIEQPHVVSENPHNLLTRIVSTKQPVHSSDLTKERAYIEGNPRYVALVETVGARSLLVVPMVKNEELIGAIAIYWQEARSFTEKQMELISNFAAQAVIAIDNARLLSELRESLQQQTATADVLKVISRSTFDLQAVLDTLVKSAASLCEADQSFLYRRDGEKYVWAASHGYSPEFVKLRTSQPLVPNRGTGVGRAIVEGKIVHIPDVLEDKEYSAWDLQQVAGYRAVLGVPLLREGVSMGVFSLARKDPRSFSDKQIELLTMFADQAAIAMENVRLFESVEARTRDLAKSLEDLRATQDRLVQTQKLASLGQLTAGIAHEIKNPLNFVNNFSGVSAELIDELQDALKVLPIDQKARAEINELTDTLRSNLDKVVQHGKRADAIVKNMLLHSREGSGEHRVVDINTLVEESLNLAYHGARAEKQGFNITMKRSLDPDAGQADVFPQDLTRVVLNLISNGFYAATKRRAESDGAGYEPTLVASTRSLGDRVEIRVRDNGTGIPPEVKEKIFNPFFTTKPAGEGTGLGLSICHDIIVKQHGGSIEVDTQPGEFTEIRVILPRVSALLS